MTAAGMKMFPREQVFLFESGRSCLYALLKSLDLSREDEVLLQAYTCVAVPEPVLWVGAKPVYVDCDETLTMSIRDLERKITPQSKVLIIQHTFGRPAHLRELLALAQKHHLFVIEDCAHALGAQYEGKNVGTFGDASFFSFGRDKVVSSIFGGVLILKDGDRASKVSSIYKTCSQASLRWIAQQLLHPIITGIAKATYTLFFGKILLALGKKIGLLSKAVEPVERHGGKPHFLFLVFPNALACLAHHQLQKLSLFNEHRAKIAEIYDRNFQTSAHDHTLKSIVLRYVLRVKDPANVLKAAMQENIYLGDWYTTAIAPSDVHYDKIGYNPDDCPMAEKIAGETINLPTDINTSEKDVQRILTFLKKFPCTQHSRYN